MKKVKFLIALIVCMVLFFGTSSCIALGPRHHGQKTPRGWNKNSNNPHHHNTTNPGHTKKKHK